MHVIAWNIRWGGQDRIDRIVETIHAHSPDLIVLSEYQPKASPSLLHALSKHGLAHQALSVPPGRTGGVAIVSRHELRVVAPPAVLAPFAWRYLPVAVPVFDVEVVGLYGPLQKEPHDAFWNAALDSLEAVSRRNVLVVGDFNTGESLVDTPVSDFFCSKFFEALPTRGYIDLWRHQAGREAREYSWLGRVNPFRLDHAFGTRGVVERLKSCRYSHAERQSGASDHSLLSVELSDAAV